MVETEPGLGEMFDMNLFLFGIFDLSVETLHVESLHVEPLHCNGSHVIVAIIDNNYAMHVVWHNDKCIQYDKWEMILDFLPELMCHFA